MMTQELDLEDPLAIVSRLAADDGATLIAALADDEAQTLVDRLKAGADKYWAINPNRSLEMADTIITIAAGRDNLSHKALGMMARGDALKLLGSSQEAWDALGNAGEIFLQIGDEVGWARTRIGRIFISINVEKTDEALADAYTARAIFVSASNSDFLLRLDINLASFYYVLGINQDALFFYHSALDLALSMQEQGEFFLGRIYSNLGLVYYSLLGNLDKAWGYFEQARTLAANHGEMANVAQTELNMASLAIVLGQYPLALRLLYHSRDLYESEQLYFDINYVNHEIVECYLALNRYDEAYELVNQIIEAFHSKSVTYKEALSLLQLANAETKLLHYDEAEKALNKAEAIYADLKSHTWVAIAHLRRGQLALRQNRIQEASNAAEWAVNYFKTSDQKINLGMAILLQAQVQLASNDLDNAKASSITALKLGHQANVPLLRYGANLLLGHVAKNQGDFVRTERRYQAAVATIEQVQRDLTITLSSEFLEDKSEAIESLIALYIQLGNRVMAFETLERAKSQVFFNYVANRQLLHWPQNSSECQILIQELEKLRGEHHWWYQKAHTEVKDEQSSKKSIISFEDALKEITIRERRMRYITEQLYLQSKSTSAFLPSSTPQCQDIQNALDEQSLLIEFYYDDSNMWIFSIDTTTCEVQQSHIAIPTIEQDLNFLHFNINTTLTGDRAQITMLTRQVQFLLQRLCNQLLMPIASRLKRYQRLIFVPYGVLHYVPFHLLFMKSAYLIESYEIIVLPAAGYVTRMRFSRTGGARVIANSLHGTLPYAVNEAEFVHDLFGGPICVENDASHSALSEAPTQILHIATHAEYRQQQPDLSYIELADGHLLTDDLFQQDLSYELVTLSACETGRSHVSSSDELIGLGRGFLYAGAGALVTSLWRVIDEVTPHLMQLFYSELYVGASKSAALRSAQLAILKEDPQMHPAFWGAFQLVGDPRPLSIHSTLKNS